MRIFVLFLILCAFGFTGCKKKVAPAPETKAAAAVCDKCTADTKCLACAPVAEKVEPVMKPAADPPEASAPIQHLVPVTQAGVKPGFGDGLWMGAAVVMLCLVAALGGRYSHRFQGVTAKATGPTQKPEPVTKTGDEKPSGATDLT